MKIHTVAQGSDAWHALRGQHFTASEAPAMMGASKYQSRSELLSLKKTGIAPEVTPAQQFIFDKGHTAEAGARPIIEAMIGEELYPVVGTEGNLLASLDGATMLGETIFEHKLWNEKLVAQVQAGELEPHYYWQLEQQLLVSGAEKAIFVCSDGTADNLVHMEYRPVPGRAEQLLAGWKQFEADLAAFEPSAPTESVAIGRAPENLPALHIEVTGMVTASNLAAFKDHALAVFGGISRDLQNDQDFANAESTVKWCKSVEDKLEAAKAHALSQTASIDELFNTIDAISESARATRLELDKLVKARKEARRLEIKQGAEQALAAHIDTINKRLGKVRLPAIAADFAGVIKGKRTISSLQDAVDSELARAKIEANAIAEAIDANLASLRELAAEHAFLFSDAQQLVLKDNEDLVSLIKVRIAEHQAAEQRRLDAEREKIRAEEQARIEREQRAEQERVAAEERSRKQAEEQKQLQAERAEPAKVAAAEPEVPQAAPVYRSAVAAQAKRAEPQMITIPREQYDELLAAQRKLEALEAAGVDNWDGYSYAMEILADEAA